MVVEEEIKYQSNGQPYHISFEDLKAKLGYKTYQPKIGNVGRALMNASKNHRSIKWLKNHLDTYFKKIRDNKKEFKAHGTTK